MINGHNIKYTASEYWSAEVEKFLANGGTICKDVVNSGIWQERRKKPTKNVNSEVLAAAAQRRKIQQPVLQEYAEWGGKGKWTKLSDKIGGKVNRGQLCGIYQGNTSVKDPELWREVVKAIEELRSECK